MKLVPVNESRAVRRRAAISRELDRIQRKHHRISGELVVKEAEPEDSFLHPFFEWDNGVAGHLYRLEQARSLLRIRLEIDVLSVEMVVPLYVKDPGSERRQAYVATTALALDADRSLQTIQDELKRVAGLISRLRVLAAALGLTKVAEAGLRDLLRH